MGKTRRAGPGKAPSGTKAFEGAPANGPTVSVPPPNPARLLPRPYDPQLLYGCFLDLFILTCCSILGQGWAWAFVSFLASHY